jgi:YHS domain-containing protein
MFRVILDFLPTLLLLLFLRSIVVSFLSNRRRARSAPTPPQRPVQSGGELKKDPVCGTYVSVAASVTRSINGQIVHFCSKECRDRYGLQ